MCAKKTPDQTRDARALHYDRMQQVLRMSYYMSDLTDER